jgi:hypothetical protein
VIEKPAEKIQEYIEHRLQREREILDVIRRDGPVTGVHITTVLYKALFQTLNVYQIPNFSFKDLLATRRIGAYYNVRHHLTKLLAEGKIQNVGLGIGQFGFGLYKLAPDKEDSERRRSKL